MKNYLKPTYIETDFDSARTRLTELMKSSDVFKDYDFTGSNISMLIDLISYLTDMSTYFSNKIVKNIYPESAEIYETMHSIASIRGYLSKGHLAPQLDAIVSITLDEANSNLPSKGEQIFIPAWFFLNTGYEIEGETVYYTTTDEYVYTIPEDLEGNIFSFSLPLKQGKYNFFTYMGKDIINNKILLPNMKIDYDTEPYDENPSIWVYVNGNPWKRVNLYEILTTPISKEENVYMLQYNKYKQHNLVFSLAHNIPEERDRIDIIFNETLGPSANITSNILTSFDIENDIPIIDLDGIKINREKFITWGQEKKEIDIDSISIYNPYPSYGASLPEDISEIKDASKNYFLVQYRNINEIDYSGYLTTHPDIIKATAWGENVQYKESHVGTNVYISVIPEENKSEIELQDYPFPVNEDYLIYGESFEWNGEILNNVIDYTFEFKKDVLDFLEPRKFINTHEFFVVPDFVYFAFEIGLRIKRGYNFNNVKNDVKNKLIEYFKIKNRNFSETIDFREIYNYLFITFDEKFPLTRGISSLVIRDISTYTPSLVDPETIYDENNDENYPMFIEDYSENYENVLKSIQLGFKQFPILIPDLCEFLQE